MRTPLEASGEAGARREGLAYRLATAVSYLINPLVLPPVGFGLVLWHLGAPAGEIARIVAVALVFFFLLPLAFLVHLARRGEVESIEVRRRERRLKPFLAGIAFCSAGVAAVAAAGQTAVPLLVALALLYPLNTALVGLITLRWKISVHAAGLAGLASILLFVAFVLGRGHPEAGLTAAMVAPLLALVPLVMWARVRVGAHTPGEVVAGALFGLLVPAAELWLVVHALGLAE